MTPTEWLPGSPTVTILRVTTPRFETPGVEARATLASLGFNGRGTFASRPPEVDDDLELPPAAAVETVELDEEDLADPRMKALPPGVPPQSPRPPATTAPTPTLRELPRA